MALNPKETYGGQVQISDPTYPYGKARNKTTVGDTNGTPLERQWVNDLWGWQQALLAQADLDPSGTPDKVGASQYLQAIQRIIRAEIQAAMPPRIAIPLVKVTEGAAWIYTDPSGSAEFSCLQQATLGNLVKLTFTLPFAGMLLAQNGLIVQLQGASGHSALPATMPKVSLSEVGSNLTGIDEAGLLLVDRFPDPASTTSSYQQVHIVRPTLAARTIQGGEQYWVQIDGEAGTNALTGLRLYGVFISIEPQP
jgi:hypothetical protein